jgi:hypothetical protein
VYVGTQLAAAYAAASSFHRLPPLWWQALLLIWWWVPAAGQAAMWHVAWDRQKKHGQSAAAFQGAAK